VAEQHEIARRIESLFALVDNVEQRAKLGSVGSERLVQAVLTKAFRGELVPTEAELARREGREYEPGAAGSPPIVIPEFSVIQTGKITKRTWAEGDVMCWRAVAAL
jgi:hypothetical protein